MSIIEGKRNVQQWVEEPCLLCTHCSASFRVSDDGKIEAENHAKTHTVPFQKEGFVYITEEMLTVPLRKSFSRKFSFRNFEYHIDWAGDGWYKLIEKDSGYRTDDYFTGVDALIDEYKQTIKDAAAAMKWLKEQKKRLEDGF